MEVSEVRKRVRETIDRAKRQAATRRTLVEEAANDYQRFLDQIAVPLFRQLANILRAERHPFSVSTPGGSVRLTSDRTAQDYIELSLDTTNAVPQVMVHSSRSWGRDVIESEAPIEGGGAIRTITEGAVLTAVLERLEPMVER
jgi:hypothetical protein